MPDTQNLWLALGVLFACGASLLALRVAREAFLIVARNVRQMIGMHRRIASLEQEFEFVRDALDGDDSDHDIDVDDDEDD